jgi:hypothetical protein
MTNKKKNKIPTIEEFNNFKPKRFDFKWKNNDSGLVTIIVPKFHSKIGINLCKLIKKENEFSANLDKIGSIIWNLCDGSNTVKIILDNLKKQFPDEKNIDQRLYAFLQQMKNLNYIDF